MRSKKFTINAKKSSKVGDSDTVETDFKKPSTDLEQSPDFNET